MCGIDNWYTYMDTFYTYIYESNCNGMDGCMDETNAIPSNNQNTEFYRVRIGVLLERVQYIGLHPVHIDVAVVAIGDARGANMVRRRGEHLGNRRGNKPAAALAVLVPASRWTDLSNC